MTQLRNILETRCTYFVLISAANFPPIYMMHRYIIIHLLLLLLLLLLMFLLLVLVTHGCQTVTMCRVAFCNAFSVGDFPLLGLGNCVLHLLHFGIVLL